MDNGASHPGQRNSHVEGERSGQTRVLRLTRKSVKCSAERRGHMITDA